MNKLFSAGNCVMTETELRGNPVIAAIVEKVGENQIINHGYVDLRSGCAVLWVAIAKVFYPYNLGSQLVLSFPKSISLKTLFILAPEYCGFEHPSLHILLMVVPIRYHRCLLINHETNQNNGPAVCDWEM